MRFNLTCAILLVSCSSSQTRQADQAVFSDRTADIQLDTGAVDLPDATVDAAADHAIDSALDSAVDSIDGTDSTAPPCTTPADCDDGLDCTEDHCGSDGVCFTTPAFECDWPAEPSDQAINLTAIEGPLINDMHKDLSGAVWNPAARMLWVCRNSSSDSRVWAIDEDAQVGFKIAEKNGERGEWNDFGDAEGLTLADLAEPETLYLIIEGNNQIVEYDFSTYGTSVKKNDWGTGASMPAAGNFGAEGITFVPDSVLKAGGFVDSAGKPYVSKNGMGGVMLVGHQTGGAVYAFDLNRQDGSYDFVGAYKTGGDETAGLELDRSSGLLYIWHGEDINTLEVARLSSQLVDGERVLDSAIVYKAPPTILLGSDNHEGIAIMTDADCNAGHRGLFITTDGGGFWSLLWYRQFPCAM